METTLAPALTLTVHGFEFTEAGLSPLPPGAQPTFEDWQEAGEWLRGVERHIQFWIGDWVNYGRERWGEQAEQGIASEVETLAAEATGWKPATVDQYARVARQVPPENRDAALPFGHHREVADKPLAEQRPWLAKAKTENWSTSRLRAELQRAEPEADTTCWIVVRCKNPEDREALRDRLVGEGREVKLP